MLHYYMKTMFIKTFYYDVRGVFFQYKDRDPSAVIIFTI